MKSAAVSVSSRVQTPSVIECFFNIDLRNGHDGLGRIAKEHGIKVDRLVPGQFVVFVNPNRTKLKVYASNDVVIYARSRHAITPEMIANLPSAFRQGDTWAIGKALKSEIVREFGNNGKSTVLPFKSKGA